MVKIVSFMLYIFYHNKNDQKKKRTECSMLMAPVYGVGVRKVTGRVE